MSETVGVDTKAGNFSSPTPREEQPPSILSLPGSATSPFDEKDVAESFVDLHLDQVFATVTAGHDEYNLMGFFQQQLPTEDEVRYRQEVFRDLEVGDLAAQITLFAERMREMRLRLQQAAKLRARYQQESWIVDAAEAYSTAVTALAEDLNTADITSRGLGALRDYLHEYVDSARFTTLLVDIRDVKEHLAAVNYTVRIRGQRVTVARYENESDYSDEVLATFERFKQGLAKDHAATFAEVPDMNHVEANILSLVGKLFPETFSALDAFAARHSDLVDATIGRFDREVQFYLAYLAYIEPLKASGLSFCHPEVTRESKEIFAEKTFDVALASKLIADHATVVTNDLRLVEPERIIIVSGPNQGGKTTFARTFGQLHYLANIGCPIPGSAARMFFFDRLFTHFEREEDLSNFSGKLEEDLVRIQAILTHATGNSVLVTNEIFTSTTLQDARFLGMEVIHRVIDLDMLCVYVTFVDELTALGPSIVSMVSTVDPDNLVNRTYKVVRRPADGLAYAMAIAERYRLTYDQLKGRVHS